MKVNIKIKSIRIKNNINNKNSIIENKIHKRAPHNSQIQLINSINKMYNKNNVIVYKRVNNNTKNLLNSNNKM